MSRAGRVAPTFKPVKVSKFDDNGCNTIVIRGGALDDGEAWIPGEQVVQVQDHEFIKITKTDVMLAKLCGTRFTRSRAYETLVELRNTACTAALIKARQNAHDYTVTKRALDASLTLPLAVTIELFGVRPACGPVEIVLQYVTDLRNAVAVSTQGDSLHHVCESLNQCTEKGEKHMRDSVPLGDGFSYSNKKKCIWQKYSDVDGAPRRRSTSKAITAEETDDPLKVQEAKTKMMMVASPNKP